MKKVIRLKKHASFSIKFDLKMKLTTLFLTVSLFQLQATESYAQKTKVTLTLEKVSIESVLDKIESLSEFKFIYKDKVVDYHKIVSIKAENEKISSILEKLFAGSNIVYSVLDKHIILKSRESNNLPKNEKTLILEEKPQEIKVSGTIKDSNGQPLSGVNILVKGTTTGTLSDFDGNYSINATVGNVLVFSYVGFSTQEITLGEQTTINIQLKEDLAELDAVVLIGYGTQKKSSLTASVASVDVGELQKTATHNPAIALQGRVSGVQILTQGGIAGAGASVVIRGVSSFGESEPLYIIDGAFSNTGLRAVNSADIQSMEILKDGAAAAIYGSRAANGVVIITTKRGKKGAPRVTFSTSLGIQTVSKKLDYLNADQWRSFANQVSDNDGSARAPENVSPNFSAGVNTDWQDLWISDAPIYMTDASISGGGENTDYLMSLGHLKQDGILALSEFEKYNMRLNFGFRKGKFEVQESLGISYSDKISTIGYQPGGSLPTIPVRDADGNFVAGGADFYIEGDNVGNPYAGNANNDANTTNTNLTGSIDLSYEIITGLKYKLGFSGSYNTSRSFADNNIYSVPVLGEPNRDEGRQTNSLSETIGNQFDYTIDQLLTYNAILGKHDISALAGYSQYRENSRILRANTIYNSELDTQQYAVHIDGTANSSEFKSLLVSYFGRLNYAFDSKYLISASIRRDRSSKFAPGNDVGVFPAASIGWNIHNENFFPKDGIISKLKIRGSYGELGANFINSYSYISNAFGPIPAIFGNSQNSPDDRSFGVIAQLADSGLKWETSQTKGVGIELGFLNNALNFTAEYFNKRQNDLLAQVPLAPSVGQSIFINNGFAPAVNSASVENKGLEFLADYKNYNNKFKYNITANLSTVNNKVLKLGDNVSPILGNLISGSFDDRPTITDVGLPIGSFIGYQVEGVDDATGDFIFKDQKTDEDGDGIFTENGIIDDNDKVILGDSYADFTYGLNFTGEYKDFDFTLFFEGSQGGEIFSQIKYTNYFIYSNNVVIDALNMWTPTNTSANLPRAISDNRGGGNALPSDFYIEDASYLRLSNIQIGYNLPQTILDKLKVSNVRAYVSANNLFTISGYSGYDPQVSSEASFSRGVDLRAFPNTRTYTFGLNISL